LEIDVPRKQADIQDVRSLLGRHGQAHLLDFYDELDGAGRRALLDQIADLDFSVIPEWIAKYVTAQYHPAVPDHFERAVSYPPQPSPQQARKYQEAVRLGVELLHAGKVAPFVVAGGQGTRLGFDGPKGDFPISPVRNKTLFRLFAEAIAAASKKYRARIPWYIMTSPLNHAQTIAVFEANGYFGLDKSDVMMFQQGTNPCFAADGRILLADKGTIASSPDGHGGSLRALYKSGALDDMKRRGVEYISYWQVDNPLINIFDPLFIGLHALDNAQMSSKALAKAHPKERVGNFCLVDGRVTVIEYSDLKDEQVEMRDPEGNLVFEMGSIGIHVISTSFVTELNADGFALPMHRADKRIEHVDSRGNMVIPPEKAPNGIKLETFVFDALPLAGRSVILQTVRGEEFGPIKNSSGDDSPAVTRQMMIERAAGWLEAAGVKVPRKKDGSCDCVIEIAPSFALHKEDVAERAGDVGPIERGESVYLE
jgi:UDP-N-acetylglucosamine/UDP-N-acetylgalactosamine diphosphorylase